MDRLTSMSVYLRVVEKGGFSAAAEEFDISPTMVGKHVRALEERLGGRLLNRTTRSQSLTELGRTYYERCKQVVADVEAMEDIASEMRSAPRGVLRVNAPMSFGSMQLAPALADYLERFPEVQVDLSLNDRVVDLVDEGANRNSALKQHFGYMPPGLALPAAGGGSDENWFCHGYGSFTF